MSGTTFKSYTMTELAGKANVDLRTFRKFFTQQNYVDMIMLGWIPHDKKIHPKACKYVQEVVVGEKSRLEVFKDLESFTIK